MDKPHPLGQGGMEGSCRGRGGPRSPPAPPGGPRRAARPAGSGGGLSQCPGQGGGAPESSPPRSPPGKSPGAPLPPHLLRGGRPGSQPPAAQQLQDLVGDGEGLGGQPQGGRLRLRLQPRAQLPLAAGLGRMRGKTHGQLRAGEPRRPRSQQPPGSAPPSHPYPSWAEHPGVRPPQTLTLSSAGRRREGRKHSG